MDHIHKIKDRLSWWEYEHFFKDLDYTIVGGGIVGLSTAIELKNADPDAKVLIIDKKQVPIGASTKNAGFACFGSPSEIIDDYNQYGEDVCRKLIQMRWSGLNILKSRVSESKMNYLPRPGAEIFEEQSEFEYFEKKLPFINAFIGSVIQSDNCYYSQQGRFGNEIVNRLEGAINPQKMMKELEILARNLGVLFLSGIDVDDIDFSEKELSTNFGKMIYNRLIICANGFSNSILPDLDIKPARNQVLITNRIPGFKLDQCYHMNKGFIYFREYDGRLLIGGGRDLDIEGETTDEFGTTEFIVNYLKGIIQQYILPNIAYTIDHSWSGILGVGDTKMPLVKQIDENVLIAIRMGGMGVAVGSYIGQLAAGMILSDDNSAQQLYVS